MSIEKCPYSGSRKPEQGSNLSILSQRKTSRQGLTEVTAGTRQDGQTRTKNRNEHMRREQKCETFTCEQTRTNRLERLRSSPWVTIRPSPSSRTTVT